MIGKLDEYLVHQTEKPLAEVASDHLHWQERLYFNIHDRQGKFAAISGLGAYHNRKSMDAYLFVVHDGHHYAYYNARPLAADRDDMRVGSLSYSIVEPLRAWRLDLADEANAIQASLEFQARCPLYEFSSIYWQKGDKLVVHQRHYTQAGTYRGTFSLGDKQFSDLIGLRDRSWGVRAMPDVDIWIWVSAQFETYCLTAWLWETHDGQTIHADGALVPERGDICPLRTFKHDLQLWPGTKRPRQAQFTFEDDSGQELRLEAREISTIFLGRNPSHWSEDDKEALAAADAGAFGFDQYTQFTLGNDSGYGIVEYMVTGGSRRYGIPPTSLAI